MYRDGFSMMRLLIFDNFSRANGIGNNRFFVGIIVKDKNGICQLLYASNIHLQFTLVLEPAFRLISGNRYFDGE
jgi:hypothetical protein